MVRKWGVYSLYTILLLGLSNCAWRADEDEVYGDGEVFEENGERQNGGWFGDGDGAGDFDTYDTDNDGFLDEEEFCEGVDEAGIFDRWDEDDNGLVETYELSEEVFAIWDDDNNGVLEEDEWYAYRDEWFEEDYAYDEWNTDEREGITELEFQQGLVRNEVLDAWDGGRAGLDNEEFCDMARTVADANENDRIEEYEWDRFYEQWR